MLTSFVSSIRSVDCSLSMGRSSSLRLFIVSISSDSSRFGDELALPKYVVLSKSITNPAL